MSIACQKDENNKKRKLRDFSEGKKRKFVLSSESQNFQGKHGEKCTPREGNAKSASPAKTLRCERYRLLSLARDILMKEGKSRSMTFPANIHRTAHCCVDHYEQVGINRTKDGAEKKAYYTGLIRCGSVWSCPVCSEKIQEQRRFEVQQGMEWAYKNGYKCLLVTFTFHHEAFDKCADLLKAQSRALKLLRGGKVWDRVKKEIGFLGLIRALEVTYTKNGWHPHTHEIWIVNKECDVKKLFGIVLARWKIACEKAGLLPCNKTRTFDEHALDIIDNASTSDYLAKHNTDFQKDLEGAKHWGADKELARSSLKVNDKRRYKKFKGRTPFTILADSRDNVWDEALFLEYSLAFKGKPQIFWSHGVKKIVGISEKADEDLAKEEEKDKAEVLAKLNFLHWELILAKDARAEILDIAEKSGFDGVKQWLWVNKPSGAYARDYELFSYSEEKKG